MNCSAPHLSPHSTSIRPCARHPAWAAAWLLVFTVTGCARSPYVLAPVRGTVTIDGRPVSQAKVMFAPVEVSGSANPGKPAFGLLRDDGNYTLSTYERDDGAIVGNHWVTLVSLGSQPQHPPFSRITIPQQVTVSAGKENQIDINLTSQQVAQYGVLGED